jgi:hypothetical protein
MRVQRYKKKYEKKREKAEKFFSRSSSTPLSSGQSWPVHAES